MSKSKRTTSVNVLLDDQEKVRVDGYRRSLESLPGRSTAVRDLMLIGLQITEAEADARAQEDELQ